MNIAIIVFAIMVAVGAQLIIKLRFNTSHGQMPSEANSFFTYMIELMKDPWLWLAGIMLVSAAIMWYFVVSRISLSVAFAFAALSYPLILIGSQFFLGEQVVYQQYIGCILIMAGITTIAYYL